VTSRERLGRCYRYEPLDRPGVYSRTGFPRGDPSYDRLKSYLQRHADLKHNWRVVDHFQPYQLQTRSEPYNEDFARQISTLQTPAGELVSTRLVSLKGRPGMREKPLLADRSDAEKYLSLPPVEVGFDVSSFFEADRAISDRGIVQVLLPTNPGGHVAGLFGSQRFAEMSVTDRDILHALCEQWMGYVLSVLEYLLAQGVGPYFALAGQEMIVPPLHGPRDFDEFNVRYDRPIIDRIHQAGGLVHVHCHGCVGKVFERFVEMGVNVLHPFEAPPMGDITAAQAKRLARGRMCLEGNIQIGQMYESTPQQIAEQTHRLIEQAFDDRRGLIVSPTASPYIRGAGEKCFPQYKAMIDTVLQSGSA